MLPTILLMTCLLGQIPVPPTPVPAQLFADAEASRDHFRGITSSLVGVNQDLHQVKNLASMSIVFDRYARKIEHLPIEGVDEEIIQYNFFIVEQLRAAAMSVRNMGIQTAIRQAQILPPQQPSYSYVGGSRYYVGGYDNGYGYRGYGYGYRPYGYHHFNYRPHYSGYYYNSGQYVYNPYAELRNVWELRHVPAAEEKAKMASDVMQIKTQVARATAEIRYNMVRKYGMEFYSGRE